MVDGASLLSYDPSHLNHNNDTQPPLRIITMKEISNLLPNLISESTLQNQKEAYIAYSSSQGTVAPVQTLGQPPAGPMSGGPNCQVCVKTGYINESDYFVSKVAGGGAEGYGNTGLVLVSSQTSLQPRYILQDNAILTEVRTAAATALASRYFLPKKKVSCIGIVGGGVQAFWQLRFLTLITDCRNVVLKTRSQATAEAFVSKMKGNGLDAQWNITVANDEEAFKKCQLIHTLTTSREPILLAKHLDLDSYDVHISAVGADSPGKRELGSCLLDRAEVIACDSLVQTVERGEGQYCNETQMESIVEIGALVKDNDRMPAEKRKKNKTMLTIFDTSGIALQDVCIAKAVCTILEKVKESK